MLAFRLFLLVSNKVRLRVLFLQPRPETEVLRRLHPVRGFRKTRAYGVRDHVKSSENTGQQKTTPQKRSLPSGFDQFAFDL